MKFPNWAKIAWWAVLVIGTAWFLSLRFADIASGHGVGIDALAIVLFVALLLAPLFAEISMFGIKLRQEINELKADVASIKMEVRQDIRNTLSPQFNMYPSAPSDQQLPGLEESIRPLLEEMLRSRGISPAATAAAVPEVPDDVVFLFSLRRSIEQEVRRLAMKGDIDPQRHTASWILNQLVDKAVVPYEIAVAVKDVYRVCTPAIHGDPVTGAQARFARDVGPRMLRALKSI